MINYSKLLYLEGIALNDISALLSPKEISSFLERTHRARRVLPENAIQDEMQEEIYGQI